MFFAHANHTVKIRNHTANTLLEKFSLTDDKKYSESIISLVSWQNRQTVGREMLKQYKEGNTGSNTIRRWLRGEKEKWMTCHCPELVHLCIYIVRQSWNAHVHVQQHTWIWTEQSCTLSLLHSHGHKHIDIDIFPFALWARQQLCLVQVEEQLMNQTELLKIHICWHSPAAAIRLAFAGLPRPRPGKDTTDSHVFYAYACTYTPQTHTSKHTVHIPENRPMSMLSAIPKSLSFLFWNNWGCRHLMRRQEQTESIWPQLT